MFRVPWQIWINTHIIIALQSKLYLLALFISLVSEQIFSLSSPSFMLLCYKNSQTGKTLQCDYNNYQKGWWRTKVCGQLTNTWAFWTSYFLPWVLIWRRPPLYIRSDNITNLHCSEKGHCGYLYIFSQTCNSAVSHWYWLAITIYLISKVSSYVEVKALYRPLEFLLTKLISASLQHITSPV